MLGFTCFDGFEFFGTDGFRHGCVRALGNVRGAEVGLEDDVEVFGAVLILGDQDVSTVFAHSQVVDVGVLISHTTPYFAMHLIPPVRIGWFG